MGGRRHSVLALVVAASLTWAAVEAQHLGRGRSATAPATRVTADPGAVEASFAPILEARHSGRTEQALLALQERAAKGPHPGYAEYWLGELAYAEQAFPAAVRHYRNAVDAEPAVADRNSAFSSADAIAVRLTALQQGPWAVERPPEIRDLYYLQRRLAGGCE